LSASEAPPTSQPPQPEATSQKPYERKFSFLQRVFKVLVSPREGMEDVALAPSYGEVFWILAIQMFASLVIIALIFSKIHFVGVSPAVWAILTFALAIGVVFAYGFLVAIWLIESVIVKFACNKGSGWNLKTAASITGYTCLVDILLSIISMIVSWIFIPSIVIDVKNLELTQQTIAALKTQLNWLWLCLLPVSLFGIIWKSHLGGLGANFGTERKCPQKLGFVVFFCIGLVGLLISIISSILR